MSEGLARRKRIVSRIILRKHLPEFTYRWDARTPKQISSSGFMPWAQDGKLSLIEHVTSAFAVGHEMEGQLAKKYSQWVSTGAYGMIKKLDPTFAQQVLNTNLYMIRTKSALITGDFYDANDHFDRHGIARPYATQREWVKLGGVPAGAVIKCMTGKEYMSQYDFVTGAPPEDKLTGWEWLPAREEVSEGVLRGDG